MSTQAALRRTIHPEIRIADASKGLVEYIASSEAVDSYREVIRADGWKFDDFQKNAPFVDSHDYSTVQNLLGKVVDFQVKGRQLVEMVQWAIDVPDNSLARLGFAMTQGGYLKAVSVGFLPTRYATKWDTNPGAFQDALNGLDLPADKKTQVTCIYLEQQQKELSACVIGANPDAVARSYKAGLLTDADLETLSTEHAKCATAFSAFVPADAEEARQRARMRFLVAIQTTIQKL